MKKIIVVAAVFFLCGFLVFAGDIAQYINLGFSDDSRYFMFGQYGISSNETKAFAETYIVDIEKNDFIRNGINKKIFSDDVLPGQDGLGALITVMENSLDSIKKVGINHIATGRVVYLLVNGAKPKENLEFRDFYRGDKYIVTLIQEQFGTGEDISSAFHINLSVTDKNDKTSTYTIGLPNYKRKDVLAYRIKQVVFTPAEDGLVFILEKEISDSDGKSIRYMVETMVF